MSKKTVGYIHLEWTCPNCGGKNPGPQKTCGACGAPQPEDVQFEQTGREELKTDRQTAAAAAAGADIHCPYCNARNPATAQVCSQCGGDISEGMRRVSGRVVGAYRTEQGPVREIACPNCATPNPETNATCSACGASLAAPRAPESKPAPVPAPAAMAGGEKKTRPASRALGAVALVVLLAVCAFIAFSLLRTDQVSGTVRDVTWESTILVEELRDVTRQAWLDEIPAGTQVLACEERYHHTQDQPAANSVEVCGTPYTVDTGTGIGQVVQDCFYEVYQDYCEYRAQEWQVVDRAVRQGSDLNLVWPQVQLSQNQREGERQSVFEIEFETSDGMYTFTTRDEALFNQFTPGSEWELVINSFNQVVDVKQK